MSWQLSAVPTGATLTIPNGAVVSNEIPVGASQVGIISPAALDALTFTIEAGDAVGGNFGTLQTGGADITLSAAKALVIIGFPFGAMRLRASGNVAADRAFQIAEKG
jgi:hypothetical protein